MSTGKIALVTGASSGIGRELARIHAEQSGDLILVARREERLRELQKELENTHGRQVTVIASDLARPDAAKDLYDEICSQGLSVDYLINNAGFGGLGKFFERPWESDQAMIQLNITALTELTRLFLPEFVKRNSGRILNVSSTASLVPGGPMQAVYYATKAYVTSFTYGIAEELHDTDVMVTALLPGATATEFGDVSGMSKTNLFKQTVNARSVAEDGYTGMIAGKLRVITGLSGPMRAMIGIVPHLPLGFSSQTDPADAGVMG